MINCKVGGVAIDLILDLGAKVSIIEQKFYDRFLSEKFKLSPSSLVLRTYSGEPIECRGFFTAPVQIKGSHQHNARFFVTTCGRSIMGVDLFDAFRGTVMLGDWHIISQSAVADDVFPVVNTVTTVSLDDYPVLLKTSGMLKGFIHKPHIDPAVRPTQQKFWHPPLAMRAPIEAELRRMEAAGVLERIDASPWTSNILTARKKDGGIRICANLTAVNKALIPERYPLPTMAELTERLAGSRFSAKQIYYGATRSWNWHRKSVILQLS